jgi:hypothetical protein
MMIFMCYFVIFVGKIVYLSTTLIFALFLTVNFLIMIILDASRRYLVQ